MEVEIESISCDYNKQNPKAKRKETYQVKLREKRNKIHYQPYEWY